MKLDARQGSNLTKDGWFQQQQQQDQAHQQSSKLNNHGNPDDMVMNVSIKQHSPNMNKRSNSDGDRPRKVIIERDKSGTCGDF